jgi:hypothetical protein
MSDSIVLPRSLRWRRKFHPDIKGTAVALLPLAGAFAQTPPTPDQNTTPAQPAQGGGTTFESLDANSDGKISKDEAKVNANVTAQFTKYDMNGDGFIEKEEVNAANSSSGEPPAKQ